LLVAYYTIWVTLLHLFQACFFNAFPPPCVPQIAEKLSLAKNSLSLAKKILSLAKKPLSLVKIPEG